MLEEIVDLQTIKLVIWDLDDTFWNGTLTEGSVQLISRNIEILKELTDRGIVSSICSKNNFEEVREFLQENEIWDYFVFPKISFSPKAHAIAQIIENANLRPNNVLFMDDNEINLREVSYHISDIMAFHPDSILPVLLEHPAAKGKNDLSHSRLHQYKNLEKKVVDRQSNNLSNEEFLVQCEIEVYFDYDIETNFERVVELVNRSNQLNYTKRRLNDLEKIQSFKAELARHDVFAAMIGARDRYGDHGIVGFYMQFRNERHNKLVHFVFSCRMMNVGLEQYVYQRLGEPEVEVIGPVSNPIKTFDQVWWIQEALAGCTHVSGSDDPRFLLLGSCDLTAVSSYCSRNRSEYVNSVDSGVMVRFDDFGFLLNDPHAVAQSKVLETVPCWSSRSFEAFRRDLAEAQVVVVSLSAAFKGAYLLTDDDVVVRVHPEGLGDYIDLNPAAGFLSCSRMFQPSPALLEQMLIASLQEIGRVASSAKTFVILGANTRDIRGVRPPCFWNSLRSYNEMVSKFAQAHLNWHYVSIDDVVTREKLVDDEHFTRMGYFDVASSINRIIAEASEPMVHAVAPNIELDIAKAMRTQRRRSRLGLYGHQRGLVAHIKRAVKVSPFGGWARKVVNKKIHDPAATWGALPESA